MLAARNKRFRVGLAFATAAYLIAAIGEIITANRVIGFDAAPRGYVISAVLIPASSLVGAVGWAFAGLAFGREIDWRRLRLGATVVATTYLVYAAGVILSMATTLSYGSAGRYGTAEILNALGTLLTAGAAGVVVFGITDSRRGPERARWLRWAMVVAVAAHLAIAAAGLVLQAYYSDNGAVHRATNGVLVGAIGSFGVAAAALFFATRVDRPLGRREAGLAGGAVLAAAATFAIAGGEALLATVYDGSPSNAVVLSHWLGVAQRVVFACVFIAVALGARTAAEPAPVTGEPTAVAG